jgi:hypothetical protein
VQDLRRAVGSHWAVTWSLPAGITKRSEVLTLPAVHLVAEPGGVSSTASIAGAVSETCKT